MTAFRLGIDFGTSSTAAILRWPDGTARPLIFDGSELLPSAVCRTGAGPLLAGRDALYAGRGFPQGLEPNPKRCVDDGSVLLGGAAVPVVELFAAVLRRVAEESVRVAGTAPARTVLTCPVGWGPRRRRILLAAAAAAGLTTVALAREPVAAAARYVALAGDRLPVGGHLLVYDLGAGTFDASVVRRTAAGFTVLAEHGLADAGGLDIDATIITHLGGTYRPRDRSRWHRLTEPSTDADRRASRQLWDDVRVAKEMLSRTAATTIALPLFEDTAPLGREELDRLAGPTLQRTVAVAATVLDRAGLTPAALTGVFLVGGASRIPLAATLLHRALGVAPTVLDRPELVVAEGSLDVGADLLPPPADTQPEALVNAQVAAPSAPWAETLVNAEAVVPPAPLAETLVNAQAEPPVPGPGGDSSGLSAARMAGAEPSVAAGPESAGSETLVDARAELPVETGLPGSEAAVPERLVNAEAVPETLVNAEAAPETLVNAGDPREALGDANAVPEASRDGRAAPETLVNAGGVPEALVDADAVPEGLGAARAVSEGLGDAGGPREVLGGAGVAAGGSAGWGRRWLIGVMVVLLVAGVWWVRVSNGAQGNGAQGNGGGSTATGVTAATSAAAAQPSPSQPGEPPVLVAGAVLTGHTDEIDDVAFSANTGLIASSSDDGTIRVWSAAGAPVATLGKGGVQGFGEVAISPDGRTVAVAHVDAGGRDIQLWDVATARVVRTLSNIGHTPREMVFSPDGRTLASAHLDGRIRLWNVAGGSLTATLPIGFESAWSVAFSPDGRTVVGAASTPPFSEGDTGAVVVWDVAGRAEKARFRGYAEVAFSPDGRTLALTDKPGALSIADLGTGAVTPLAGDPVGFRAAFLSPTLVLRARSDPGGLEVWDLARKAVVAQLDGDTTFATSADGKVVAVAGAGVIRLWSLPAGVG